MTRAITLATVILAIAAIPAFASSFALHILILIAFYGSLALAWNILGGMAGQMSLGNALFVGCGAYLSTILYLWWGISPWLGLFAAAALGGGLGAIIGSVIFRRRLKGVFFALATLALSEIGVLTVSNIEMLGSANGLSIPPSTAAWTMQFTDKKGSYFLAYGLLATCLAATYTIHRSRLGYYFAAVHQNENAAAAVGIDVVAMKIYATAISGALSAIAGVFYAQYLLFIDPEAVFGVHLAIEVLTYAFVGGVNFVLGPVVGAFVLVPLSEALRGWLGHSFAGAHLMIYGAVLILVVRFAPEGIAGIVAHTLSRRRS